MRIDMEWWTFYIFVIVFFIWWIYYERDWVIIINSVSGYQEDIAIMFHILNEPIKNYFWPQYFGARNILFYCYCGNGLKYRLSSQSRYLCIYVFQNTRFILYTHLYIFYDAYVFVGVYIYIYIYIHICIYIKIDR